MHVGIVSPYSMAQPGGVQSHVRGLTQALVRAGHDVTVFGPELRGPGLVEGAQSISLGGAVGVPANGSIAPLGIDPRMILRFELSLDAMDVLHLHEAFLPACLAALWRRPRGLPIVGTFHAAADGYWPYAVTAPLLRRAARRLTATTAVSPEARRLVTRYVPIEPVLVPNGVDVAFFRDAEPDPWAADLGIVVLFVGRAEPRKGFDVAVRAFAGAAATRHDAHLVCAGPSSAEVIAEGVADRVHCLGRVDSDRLRGLYRAADVVMVPSRHGESFGIVVVEALSAGAAVLASDIPGYRFAGGDVPRYLPPGDLRAWREALAELLGDPESREATARGGPEHALAFDWERVAEQTLDVYRRAIDG